MGEGLTAGEGGLGLRFFARETSTGASMCARRTETGRLRRMRGAQRVASILTLSSLLGLGAALASPGFDESDYQYTPAIAFSRVPVPEVTVGIADVADLRGHFTEHGYTLDRVRYGAGEVPRLLLANLPVDLTDIKTIEVRKALFIQAILPLILRANEDVAADRERLQDLARNNNWSDTDAAWLAQLAVRYGTEPGEIDELLRRVDVIPPSLALAQAAEESGWGTSRFAVEGNAVFGQWTFDPDKGLVPIYRNDGAQHLVRSFEGLLASVAGYMRNLNSHDAYAAFRNRRKQMRDDIGALDAVLLANTLLYYSEGRRDYVRKIRDIIDGNELTAFDDARLKPEARFN